MSGHELDGARAAARPTRRRLVVGGAVTAAASAAAVVVTSGPAEAASGQAMRVGGANTQSTGTTLSGPTSVPSLTVRNTGSGAAASFQSARSNGFAGGTHAPNHYGLSANNSAATQGAGAAIAAAGGVNTGIIVNTAGPGRYALAARHRVGLLETTGFEAAVMAEGGNASGVIAESSNEDAFGVLANHLEGGTAVLGTSDAGLGLMGVATGGGTGVYARADDAESVALTAEGTARFLGDVVVLGTLYAPTVVNAVPTSAEARQVAQRAARTAARIRAARSPG